MDLGQNSRHYRQLSKVGTIRGWTWANILQSWHYPKVELDHNLAKVALSEGESEPKSGKAGIIVHADSIQGWTDLGPKWSILITIDIFKGGSGRHDS